MSLPAKHWMPCGGKRTNPIRTTPRMKTGTNLKQCVRTKLQAFRQMSPQDFPLQQYVGKIVDLVLSMFEVDPVNRPFSHEVVDCLRLASDVYREARERPEDDIFIKMKRPRPFIHGEGFNELSWLSENKTLSFLEM